MKHFASSIIAFLFATAVSAAPIPAEVEETTTSGNATAIKTAVEDWQADTGIVSNFLNNAVNGYRSQAAYQAAAVNAYNAELDELTHKQVLDTSLNQTAQLENANNTLVAEGTFQSVVNLLQALTQVNYKEKSLIQQYVNEINFGHNGIQGRCAAVLPAIDEYFEQAAEQLKEIDGNTSLFGIKAIRPRACNGRQVKRTEDAA